MAMNGSATPYGIIAEFTTAADILRAAQKVRDAGFTRWDVFTPFPVHGMDKAMGLRNSQVGWFSFLGGATGYTSGMLMVWYMNAYDYPIVIGGKPMFSPFYPFVPCFELTILLGAFGAVLGMLFLNRLPRLHHPLLKNRRFSQVTHDKFFVVIECDDPKYSEAATRKLLERRRQPAHRAGGGIMRYFLALFAVCVLATVGVLGLRGSHFRRPPLYIFPDMERQPKLRPQTANAFFDDGMSSRLPVAGTIARSQPIPVGDKLIYPWQETPVNTGRVTGTNRVELNPLPVTAELLQRGEDVFNIVCAACHSKLGDGNGTPKRINAMVTVAT